MPRPIRPSSAAPPRRRLCRARFCESSPRRRSWARLLEWPTPQMTSSAFDVDRLPHRPPMRLVERVVELVAGESARAVRVAHPDDWYFQGHFPGDPVVPAIVLIELLAQTGGIAAASVEAAGNPQALRVAAVGPFKFPAGARPNQLL